MLKAVSKMALAAGVVCDLALEAPMACGFGVCLGCAVRTTAGFRYVCTHGPVFPSEALGWEAAP